MENGFRTQETQVGYLRFPSFDAAMLDDALSMQPSSIPPIAVRVSSMIPMPPPAASTGFILLLKLFLALQSCKKHDSGKDGNARIRPRTPLRNPVISLAQFRRAAPVGCS